MAEVSESSDEETQFQENQDVQEFRFPVFKKGILLLKLLVTYFTAFFFFFFF